MLGKRQPRAILRMPVGGVILRVGSTGTHKVLGNQASGNMPQTLEGKACSASLASLALSGLVMSGCVISQEVWWYRTGADIPSGIHRQSCEQKPPCSSPVPRAPASALPSTRSSQVFEHGCALLEMSLGESFHSC